MKKSKNLFVTKSMVRNTKAKRKSSVKFNVEKIEQQKYDDILEIKDHYENQKINLSDENYTIELSGDEENRLNNEVDNAKTILNNITKEKYPLSYII